MPDTQKILSIWPFKQKHLPDGTISKYKACLCVHSGIQSWGVDYWEAFAPIVNWMSVGFLVTVAKIHGIDTKTIDFVLVFSQAQLDTDVFMEIPAGVQLHGYPFENQSCVYVLKPNKSLYGLKRASANWYDMLMKGLNDCGFTPSKVDPCIFIQNDAIALVYINDYIVISPKEGVIKDIITILANGPECFKFTEEGSLANYLSVQFTDFDSGNEFSMSQPFLIERILTTMDIEMRMTKSRLNPVTKPYSIGTQMETFPSLMEIPLSDWNDELSLAEHKTEYCHGRPSMRPFL